MQIPFSCKPDGVTDVTTLQGCRAGVLEKLDEKVLITGGVALGAGAAMVSIWLCDVIMLTYCDM